MGAVPRVVGLTGITVPVGFGLDWGTTPVGTGSPVGSSSSPQVEVRVMVLVSVIGTVTVLLPEVTTEEVTKPSIRHDSGW